MDETTMRADVAHRLARVRAVMRDQTATFNAGLALGRLEGEATALASLLEGMGDAEPAVPGEEQA